MNEAICIYCVDVITMNQDGEWIHHNTKQPWCQIVTAAPSVDPVIELTAIVTKEAKQ